MSSHSRRGQDIDPEIARFIAMTGAAYRAHPPLDQLTPEAARAVAEEVRRPWRQGGPAMARTEEHLVPTPHGDIRIRLHDPAPTQPKPALLYVHGGGWVFFSLDTHDRVMREYAARGRFAVIGIDYALSPENRFPVALEQIVAAVRWVHTHAAALGIAPDRLALGGDSVGGNMSLAAAVSLRDAGEGGLLKALLLNYGAFDDRTSPEYIDRYGPPEYMLTGDEMVHFWQAYLRTDADRDNPLAVPARADLTGLPPAFLTIPECDVLTDQSLSLAARLGEAGVPVRAEIYAGATHSFLEAMSISAVATRALADGAAWLANRFAAG